MSELSDPLIPRPFIEDEIHTAQGVTLTFNSDTAMLVEHANGYDYMDHLFIRKLGDHGLRLFGIRATPFYDLLVERGYDRLLKQYPSDVTVAVWEKMKASEMERELEEGLGGELEE